jgi:hypothetical protein
MKTKTFIILGASILAFALFFFEQGMGKTVLRYPGQKIWSLKSWQFMPDNFNIYLAILGGAILLWGIFKLINKKK